MRFLSIYKSVETNTPPTAEYVGRMQTLVEEGFKAGWLLATEGCLPSAFGARVRSAGGQITVTDGPFVETKELIAGFALLHADSKDQAIESALSSSGPKSFSPVSFTPKPWSLGTCRRTRSTTSIASPMC